MHIIVIIVNGKLHCADSRSIYNESASIHNALLNYILTTTPGQLHLKQEPVEPGHAPLIGFGHRKVYLL
jgi:hypothetical protein